MKNIHILPTDKSSKLLYNHTLKSFCFQKKENGMFVNDGKVSGASFWSIEKAQHNGFCPQHIYITNSEEIKEGDWYYNERLNQVFQAIRKSGYNTVDREYKIILTTDPDLIKDGVQSISDEFLQWFVKNPSCEEVEVILNEVSYFIEDNIYKIIIPKEEPTAYHYLSCCRSIEECHCGKYPKQIKCYCGHTITCDCSPIEEPKQETLEKAAHKMLMDFGIMSVGESINVLNVKKLMVLFAKEQQERSYSEEEVRNLFRNYQYDSAQFAAIMEGDTDGKPTPTGWFEKFKKK